MKNHRGPNCKCGCGDRVSRPGIEFIYGHRPPTPWKCIIWRSVVVDLSTGCWLWKGTLSSNGYGLVMVKKKRLRAHRISYETFIGPIPEGLEPDHLCRVRRCVNPEHIEPVTPAENRRRAGWSPAAGLAARLAKVNLDFCRHGHERTPENTLNSGCCKICHRQQTLAYYYRTKVMA